MAIDGGSGAAAGKHAGLGSDKGERAAVDDGQRSDLLQGDRAGDFGIDSLHTLDLAGDFHGGGDAAELQLEGREGEGTGGFYTDAIEEGGREPCGGNFDAVGFGTNTADSEKAFSSGFGGKDGFGATLQEKFDVGITDTRS